MIWAILFVGVAVLMTATGWSKLEEAALLVGVIVLFTFAAVAGVADAHFYGGCQKNRCKHHVVAPHNSHLDAIHSCEAGHVGWFYDGAFDGGLQFSPRTWSSTGSRFTFAYQAPILEQKYRGVILAHSINWNWRSTRGWPNCG